MPIPSRVVESVLLSSFLILHWDFVGLHCTSAVNHMLLEAACGEMFLLSLLHSNGVGLGITLSQLGYNCSRQSQRHILCRVKWRHAAGSPPR